MNRKNDAVFGMYKAVKQLLTDNAATITAAGVPIVITYKTDLSDQINAISDKSPQAEISSIAVTQVKTNARLAAIKSAAVIAGGMYSYAVDTNNTELAININITPNILKLKKDEEVLDLLNIILAKASTLVTVVAPDINPLLDYGVTAGEVTALGALINAYNAITTAPRLVISTRKTNNLELANLYDVTDALLVKLDKVMNGWEDSYPTLFESYKNTRKIVGPIRIRTQLTGTVSKITDLELITTGPAENARVTVIAEPYTTTKKGQKILVKKDPVIVKTDEEGKYAVNTPDVNTTYTITCKLPGYAEQQRVALKVQKGKKAIFDFLLEPEQSL